MRVILKKDVEKVGRKGDIINVVQATAGTSYCPRSWPSK